jgi:uncharacterized repeat protein (TIGR02543 family)
MLPQPTKQGNQFGGWYTQTAGGGTQFTMDTTVNQAVTIYAKWILQVTLEANGGYCLDASVDVVFSATYPQLPAPTKSYHDFAGWYTTEYDEEDVVGVQIGQGDSVEASGGFTLYARYTVIEELQPFEFSYTETTLTITGIKGERQQIVEVVVPNIVTHISKGAFGELSALTQITLPFIGYHRDASGGEAVLGWIFGEVSFASAAQTTQYYVTSGGMSSSKYYIPNSLAGVTIADASAIPSGAFYGCANLIQINLPQNLLSIGDSAFEGCVGLTQITIPQSVTDVGVWAFRDCSTANLTIYVHHNPSSLPSGFKQGWNFSNCNVAQVQ